MEVVSVMDISIRNSQKENYKLKLKKRVFSIFNWFRAGGSETFPGYTGRVRTRLGGFLRNQALNESTKVTLVLNDNKLLKSEIMALPR